MNCEHNTRRIYIKHQRMWHPHVYTIFSTVSSPQIHLLYPELFFFFHSRHRIFLLISVKRGSTLIYECVVWKGSTRFCIRVHRQNVIDANRPPIEWEPNEQGTSLSVIPSKRTSCFIIFPWYQLLSKYYTNSISGFITSGKRILRRLSCRKILLL